jgi:hypothetical protein
LSSSFCSFSQAPDDEHATLLLSVPLGSAVAAADPVRVLQQACVTVEEEDSLKTAAAAVTRALSQTCVLRNVGTIVEVLPPINSLA